MSDLVFIIVAGLFLPLFPMSMVFNAIFDKVSNPWVRALFILVWPIPGLLIVFNNSNSLPGWVLTLALATSFLYALRLLTLREVNQWSGFLATSLWSLLWLSVIQGVDEKVMVVYALGMSAPLVILVLLCSGLEKRFGAAYTGLYGGLARTIPRYSGILVTVIIAAIATPVFPTFFILLEMVVETLPVKPYATLVLLLTWLLWSWAGARVIQGLIVGRASKTTVEDMSVSMLGFNSFVLLMLMACGLYLGGMIL